MKYINSILLAALFCILCSCSSKEEKVTKQEIINSKMEKSKTPGQKFIEGFGNNNIELLKEVLAKDVKFYGTLAWGIQGSDNVINFAAEFQKGLPGMKVVLHDEFYNAEGTRGNIRMHLYFDNQGIFMGNKPTGKSGESVESFTLKIKDNQITEIVQSGNTFPLAAIELIDFKMDYPRNTPDPEKAILSASTKEVTYH